MAADGRIQQWSQMAVRVCLGFLFCFGHGGFLFCTGLGGVCFVGLHRGVEEGVAQSEAPTRTRWQTDNFPARRRRRVHGPSDEEVFPRQRDRGSLAFLSLCLLYFLCFLCCLRFFSLSLLAWRFLLSVFFFPFCAVCFEEHKIPGYSFELAPMEKGWNELDQRVTVAFCFPFCFFVFRFASVSSTPRRSRRIVRRFSATAAWTRRRTGKSGTRSSCGAFSALFLLFFDRDCSDACFVCGFRIRTEGGVQVPPRHRQRLLAQSVTEGRFGAYGAFGFCFQRAFCVLSACFLGAFCRFRRFVGADAKSCAGFD
jgi:hypothetical protein